MRIFVLFLHGKIRNNWFDFWYRRKMLTIGFYKASFEENWHEEKKIHLNAQGSSRTKSSFPFCLSCLPHKFIIGWRFHHLVANATKFYQRWRLKGGTLCPCKRWKLELDMVMQYWENFTSFVAPHCQLTIISSFFFY